MSVILTDKDFAEKGSGKVVAMEQDFKSRVNLLLQRLNVTRREDINIHSGYRSAEHNAAVGGVPDSRHIEADAVDIEIKGYTPKQIALAGRSLGFTGIGVYTKDNFTHLDTRPGSLDTWGDFAAEIKKGSSFVGVENDGRAGADYTTPRTAPAGSGLVGSVAPVLVIMAAAAVGIFLLFTVTKPGNQLLIEGGK